MKNYAGYTKVYAGFQGSGRTVYVKNDMVEFVQSALRDYRKNYHLTTIFRQIVGLNANPLQGQGQNPAGDVRTLASGNVTLQYYMFNGVILIQRLAIGHPESGQSLGLYSVSYDVKEEKWRPSQDPVSALNRKAQWKSKDKTAHYAAIAGKFTDRKEAGERLIDHITGAYTKADYLTSSDVKDAYSMFWIEKGQHKKPEAAQQLASVVQQGVQNQMSVNWLVHGEGAHTFKNMAKLLKASTQVQNQNVYFSNPSIDSEKQLQQLCADAGMHYVDTNRSYRDLRRWSTLKNVGKELGKAGIVGLAVNGSVSASDGLRPLGGGGIGDILGNGLDSLLSGNHFTALTCAVASGVIVAGMVSKSRAVAAGVSCTFGKGNQRWYVSDAALLHS